MIEINVEFPQRELVQATAEVDNKQQFISEVTISAKPEITGVTASVDNETGTPYVDVTETGTGRDFSFDLAFHNLKGDKGDKGDTGNGIESIDKTATVDNVDTYTITYTNGNTTTFDVTNGFNPSYTHNQAVAASEWTINHNLNKHPTIVVIDSSGNTFYPPATYDDENTCTIHLLGATTGTAYLS